MTDKKTFHVAQVTSGTHVLCIDVHQIDEGGTSPVSVAEKLSEEIGQYIDTSVARGENLTIDMSNVQYINSDGIARLSGLKSKMKKLEGQFAISNVSGRAKSAFITTNLYRFLNAQDTVEATLVAFEKSKSDSPFKS